jgi:hypothetical protein
MTTKETFLSAIASPYPLVEGYGDYFWNGPGGKALFTLTAMVVASLGIVVVVLLGSRVRWGLRWGPHAFLFWAVGGLVSIIFFNSLMNTGAMEATYELRATMGTLIMIVAIEFVSGCILLAIRAVRHPVAD